MSKFHAIKYAREATGMNLTDTVRLVDGIRLHLEGAVEAAVADAKTLRDEYAMAALAGLLANPARVGGSFKDAAEVSFEYADAMIAWRGRDGQ